MIKFHTIWIDGGPYGVTEYVTNVYRNGVRIDNISIKRDCALQELSDIDKSIIMSQATAYLEKMGYVTRRKI